MLNPYSNENYVVEYEIGVTAPVCTPTRNIYSLWFSTNSADIIAELQGITAAGKAVQNIREQFLHLDKNFAKFTPMGDQFSSWGFDRVLIPVEEEKVGYTTWEISLDLWHNLKRDELVYRKLNAIAGTLYLLFSATNSPKQISDPKDRIQLLGVNYFGLYNKNSNDHHNAAALTVVTSAGMSDWLDDKFGDSEKSIVQTTILEVYKLLYSPKKTKKFSQSDFPIMFQPNQLAIYVDRIMGICLDGRRDRDDELKPYHLSTGNSCNSYYQILMLVAMAKIHDLARLGGL